MIEEKSFQRDVKKLLKMDRSLLQKLRRLMEEVSISPTEGIGCPEKLSGYGMKIVWSKRIVGKHRLIYEIRKDAIAFLACYGHYDDH
jgi:toxin YoeB